MKTFFKGAVVLVASLYGCSDEGATRSPDAFTSALSDAAAMDAAIAVPFQAGRWASRDGFEDPFEAELQFEGGILSGRVCGPSTVRPLGSLDGANCESIDDAWIRDGTVHFSYVLPYTEWDMRPRAFDVLGLLNDDGNQISASLRMDGEPATKVSHWFHCPPSTKSCFPPR